jgi:hypothetical protein
MPVAPAAGSPRDDLLDPARSPPGDRTSLLPGPSFVADPSGLASIYELLAQGRNSGVALGEQDVATHRQVQANAFADEMAAIHREEDNQRGSGSGLFSSLSRIVTDVIQDFVRGRPDSAPADVASDASAAWDSPRLWGELEKGLAEVAAVAGGVGCIAGLAGGPVGAVVEAAAKVVGEGASVGVALATSREEGFDAAAAEARANVVWDRGSADRLGREIATVIENTRTNDSALERALQSVGAASNSGDRTLVLSSAWKG